MPAATALLVLVVFFVSGAAGLAYEVVWTRQLTLVFGVTTYAVSTVLACFMAGLALGSWLFGRVADRRDDPLRVYALLEVGIGLYALLIPFLFEALRPLYVALIRADLPPALLAACRALLAAAVLVPPTTLMGGTFPILVRWWVRTRAEVGRGTGILYFVNTAGAIAGCSLAGFLLIEHLGLRGTTWLAAAVNLAAAAVAALLARRAGPLAPMAATAVEAAGPSLAARAAGLALATAAVSGFTSLGYEVLWSRALPRYLYSSTYAFTTMLSTFLAGIALGSAVYTAFLRRVGRPLVVLGVLQVLVGLGFVGSSLVFPQLPEVTAAVVGDPKLHSFGDALRWMLVGSALILLPPTLLLGASLPLAIDVYVRGLGTLGHRVGRIYAVNTLGSILGSLGVGFVLIPLIGMQTTLTLLVAVNLGLGVVLAVAGLGSTPARVGVAAAVAAAGVGAVSLMPPAFFERTLSENAVFYREGATDTVAVIDVGGQLVMLYGDRRGTAGTLSFRVNYFLGHLPMLLHQGTPKNVLHVCFGVGNSLSAVAAHPEVEHVDSVELSPHVLEAGPYFWTNADVFSNPKVEMIIDDGRNFLMASEKTYDVITLEPPEVFQGGVVSLFTREFYQDAYDHLADDGVMMAWFPTGRAPLEQELMLFRAFTDVFPHVTAWQLLDTPTILLIGSKQPQTIDYQELRARAADPKIARDLELMGVADVDQLLASFFFDDATLRAMVKDVAPVTDDRTVLDFTMPRYVGSGFGTHAFLNQRVEADGKTPMGVAVNRLRDYDRQRGSVVPLLTNLGADTPETVQARITARSNVDVPQTFVPREDWKRW